MVMDVLRIRFDSIGFELDLATQKFVRLGSVRFTSAPLFEVWKTIAFYLGCELMLSIPFHKLSATPRIVRQYSVILPLVFTC